MTFDWTSAHSQLERLRRAAATADGLQGSFAVYRQKLNQAWAAEEVTSFNASVDDLCLRCRQLSQQLNALCEEIGNALEDIQAECAQDEKTAKTGDC